MEDYKNDEEHPSNNGTITIRNDGSLSLSYAKACEVYIDVYLNQNFAECLNILNMITQSFGSMKEIDISDFIFSGAMERFFEIFSMDIANNQIALNMYISITNLIEKLLSFQNYHFAQTLINHHLIEMLIEKIQTREMNSILTCLRCLRLLAITDPAHAVPIILLVTSQEFFIDIIRKEEGMFGAQIPEEAVEETISLLMIMLENGTLTLEVPEFNNIYDKADETAENQENEPPQPQENEENQNEEFDHIEMEPPPRIWLPKSQYKLARLEEAMRQAAAKNSSSDDDSSDDGGFILPEDEIIIRKQKEIVPENPDIVENFFDLFSNIYYIDVEPSDNFKTMALNGFKSLFHRDPGLWRPIIENRQDILGNFVANLNSPNYLIRGLSLKILITILEHYDLFIGINESVLLENLQIPEENPSNQVEYGIANTIATDSFKLLSILLRDFKFRKKLVAAGAFEIIKRGIDEAPFNIMTNYSIFLINLCALHTPCSQFILRQAQEAGMIPYFFKALNMHDPRYGYLAAQIIIALIQEYSQYSENVVLQSITQEDVDIIEELMDDDDINDNYYEVLEVLNEILHGTYIPPPHTPDDEDGGMFNF